MRRVRYWFGLWNEFFIDHSFTYVFVLLTGQVSPDLWELAVLDRFRGQCRDLSHIIWKVFACQKAGGGCTAGRELSGSPSYHWCGLPNSVACPYQKVALGVAQKVSNQKEGRVHTQCLDTGIGEIDPIEDGFYRWAILDSKGNCRDRVLLELLLLLRKHCLMDLCCSRSRHGIVCRG